MKNKRSRKEVYRVWLSLALILCVVFSSVPTHTLYAGTEHFIGLEDTKVEENTKIDLLENVSAYGNDNEKLEVKIKNVTCETDNTYRYDHSNVLTVGKAGSVYTVEYAATSSADDTKEYFGKRKIVSTKSKEDSLREEVKTQGTNKEFDENQPFTVSELEGMGYSVQMEGAKIPIENFKLQCLNEKAGEMPCDDLEFSKLTTFIAGGKIKDHVPQYVQNGNNKLHSYVKAHVGEVAVYYMGKLHIEDGETSEDYIYYTTDTQITNKTVYAVLKKQENEKITLTYSHEADYRVQYQLFEKGAHNEEKGPDGWNYSDVFGEDRAISVKKGQEISVKVKIPRGYKATIKAVRTGETSEHDETLGEMMAFERDENKINLKQGSPNSMKYETSFNIKNVTSDILITVEYEKVKEIHFNAYMWTQTAYAKDRIKIHGGENPTESNSNMTTTGHSFIWEWDGVTTGKGPNGSGNGEITSHTWELDQLEINDEALIIPMVSLNDVNKTITKRTTLSSGTEVTLSVTSAGGTNAYDGKRHYRLQIDNCYEDVTITGGNMVAHRHQEYAIRELFGVASPGFYAYDEASNNGKDTWHEMRQDTLIGKIVDGKHDNDWTDPMRFKRQTGLYKPDISFTTKEGDVLQSNYTVGLDEDGDKKPYIEYLIRKDNNTSDNAAIGEYDVVSWDDWKESPDGYYYFRGSQEVKEYVGGKYNDPNSHWNPNDAYKGVILVNIKAHPIRIGLNYLNGADEQGKTAPKAEDIVNLPETQYGGKDGYNLVNNQRLLMSNMIPVDKENQFVFDHWEVQATDRGKSEEQFWGYLTGEPKRDENGDCYTARSGQEYFLDVDMLNTLDHCFYMKADPNTDQTNGNPLNDKPHKGAQTHAIITVRAVWKKHDSKPTIPYTVKYVTAEIKDGKIDTTTEKVIEERTHTVNEGAMLVTDLYQDGSKTPSASIQSVLSGENAQKEDYTRNGSVRWVVYEPKTTKKIDHVDMKNNVATIYLIKGNTKVNVEKAWTSSEHTEREITAQLQRRKTDADTWEKVENVSLNEENKWEHQFDADAYYELPSDENGLFKTWKYRVVEVDGNDRVLQDKEHIAINNHLYQVGYRFDTDKNAWVIKNTRLLDLTISKVVEGKHGDRTKEFTFDIQAYDNEGNAINGEYNYIGGVKNGYEQQAETPSNSTITFHNGKGSVKLTHGQQITIKNLPVNSKITVTEQSADGYAVSYIVNGDNKTTGELLLTKNSAVDVTNTYGDIADTGVKGSTGGIALGLGIVLIGILSFGILHLFRSRKGLK